MEPIPDCGVDDSLAARYVSGRLDEAEAEAFEAHYFACERCLGLVQQANEIRAGLSASGGRGLRSRPWLPLAAAAALLLALAGWWLTGRRDDAGGHAFRAASGPGLDVRVSAAAGHLDVTWAAVAAARRYRVRLVDADGILLVERELDAPPASIGATRLPATLAYVTVEALGPDREVLAASPPHEVRLPAPPSP
jgi:Putative zinc-finger